jgi:histone H3/H4
MAKAKANNKGGARQAAAKGPQESLLVGSKVRAIIKDADCNTAGDAVDGLNQWVYWLIQQATTRAKQNGRKTVRAHDFMAPM